MVTSEKRLHSPVAEKEKLIARSKLILFWTDVTMGEVPSKYEFHLKKTLGRTHGLSVAKAASTFV